MAELLSIVTSAHCETGVTSALFRDKGLDISEPMIFGIGSGIFFGHLPFIKHTGLPISTFRSIPGRFSKSSQKTGRKGLSENVFAVRKKAWMN